MARILGLLFAYICVATVLTQAIGLSYVWSRGKIDGDKMFRIVAVIHNVDLSAELTEQAVAQVTDKEEMSYDEKSRMKAIMTKNLDLKQQALSKGVENLRFDREKLAQDWNHYENVKNGFEAK